MFVKSTKLKYETSLSTRATRLRVHAAMKMNPSVLNEGRRIPRIFKIMNVNSKDSKN